MNKLGKHMRKIVIAVGAAALVAVSVYADQPLIVAQATQHPVNQSGAKGRIKFASVPGGLQVSGTATGLQGPSVGRYVSLVYDLPSVPGGPTVCEPTAPIDGMFVGIWAVDPSGNGILIQLAAPGEIAPLGVIDTISIRDTTINDGFGPKAVVACGEIAVYGGR